MVESDAPHWNSLLPPVGLPQTVSVGHAVASEAAEVTLTPGEEASLGVRVAETRKSDFKMGRLAARRGLAAVGVESDGLLRTESGAPGWPEGVVGSITHTEGVGVAFVALARDVEAIGIDLEKRRPVEEIEDLVAFGPESDWVRSDGTLDGRRLLSLFAAKEAVFKAFYPTVGRFFGFEAARLDWDESQQGFNGSFVDRDLLPALRTFEISVAWFGEFVLAWLVVSRSDR